MFWGFRKVTPQQNGIFYILLLSGNGVCYDSSNAFYLIFRKLAVMTFFSVVKLESTFIVLSNTGSGAPGIALDWQWEMRTLLYRSPFVLVFFSIFLGASATLRKTTTSFVMSTPLSARIEQLSSHWTDFHEIWYLGIFFPKICREISSCIIIGQE